MGGRMVLGIQGNNLLKKAEWRKLPNTTTNDNDGDKKKATALPPPSPTTVPHIEMEFTTRPREEGKT